MGMENFSKWLVEGIDTYLARTGETQESLARRLDMTGGAISKWRRGEVRNYDRETLIKMGRIFGAVNGYTADRILRKHQECYLEVEGGNEPVDWIRIPYVSDPAELADPPITIPMPENLLGSKPVYALRLNKVEIAVHGYDAHLAWSVVIVQQFSEPQPGELVIARVEKKLLTLRRWEKYGDTVVLRGDGVEDIVRAHGMGIEICGVVRGHLEPLSKW